MQSLSVLYNTFISQKKKERFEFILEPLQALIQLSCLAFCPIGSKITIYNNLLYLQTPGWTQGILRTYYKDSKDDLYFLFNVIGRYNKFYKHLKNSSEEEERLLYKLLIELARKGIDNLIQTYQQSDRTSLLHTLKMYKTMLIKPEAFNNNEILFNSSPTPSETGEYSENDEREKERERNIERERERNIERERERNIERESDRNIERESDRNIERESERDINSGLDIYKINRNELVCNLDNSIPYEETSTEPGIDTLFIKIVYLYSKEDLHVIYNTLLLIKSNPQNFESYMDGLNNILDPLNNKIKKWINDNIVF